MQFHNLIKRNNWYSVQLTLLQLYEDQEKSIDAYSDVFEQLKIMDAGESELQIALEQVFDDDTNEPSYVDVSGKGKDENGVVKSSAIEFTPWKEWLGMSVSDKTLKQFTELEIISHCLYEMTFVGFDEEQIQEQMNELNRSIEEYESMSEEDKKKNTMTFEEFKKRFLNDDEDFD